MSSASIYQYKIEVPKPEDKRSSYQKAQDIMESYDWSEHAYGECYKKFGSTLCDLVAANSRH